MDGRALRPVRRDRSVDASGSRRRTWPDKADVAARPGEIRFGFRSTGVAALVVRPRPRRRIDVDAVLGRLLPTTHAGFDGMPELIAPSKGQRPGVYDIWQRLRDVRGMLHRGAVVAADERDARVIAPVVQAVLLICRV